MPDMQAATTAKREDTHYVEDAVGRPRVYRAICGASINSGLMSKLTSGSPTCATCKRLLDEFDGDESPF